MGGPSSSGPTCDGIASMARTKITERDVGTLRTASRRSGKTAYLWDTELRGLGLRVSASGRGAWLLRAWVGGRRGKEKRLVVGYLPPMTVEEARSKARSGRLRSLEQRRSTKARAAASRWAAPAEGLGDVRQVPPTPSCRT
jgi:hypothetical protein